MANCCFTQIMFHGNKTEIEDFHKKINDWTADGVSKGRNTGFGDPWLGNILYGVGLENRIDAEKDTIRCRGSLIYVDDVHEFSDTEAVFYVETETAWCPMIVMREETIKTLNYESIGFSYLAEEPGCGLFEIYDQYGDFSEKWYVHTFLNGADRGNKKLAAFEDCITYHSDGVLKENLMSLLNVESEEIDLDALVDMVKDYKFEDEYSYISIHKYERVDSWND